MPLWNAVPAEAKPRTHLRYGSAGVNKWPPVADSSGVSRLFRSGLAFPPPFAGGRSPPRGSGADPQPLLPEHQSPSPPCRASPSAGVLEAGSRAAHWDSRLLRELLLDSFVGFFAPWDLLKVPSLWPQLLFLSLKYTNIRTEIQKRCQPRLPRRQ